MRGIKPADRRRLYSQLLERQGPFCAICMKAGTTEDNDEHDDPLYLTLGHIIPRSRGGKVNRRNLQLEHRACNKAKASLLPWEHAPSLQHDKDVIV